ncbi:MAG TPA: ABC transporter permease [Jiangellaceae bacterium]|nr:ABC transporter permease [Jiangellaceae bacterium]
MLAYLVLRTAILAGSLVVASMITFALLSLLPGDPAQTILGVNATPDAVATLREQLGTDRSAVVQYLDWAAGMLRGDLGTSAIGGLDIGTEITRRLTVTVPLVLGGMTLACLLAAPLGVLAALQHRRPLGVLLTGLSQVGIAVPAFWSGMLVITVVAVGLGVLPAGGFPRQGWSDVGGAVQSLILPVTVLGVAQAAIIMRYVRSSVLDVIGADFIRTARAKGLSRWQSLRRHALRNAALPVVTVLGLQLATLLIGSVVIEQVFNLPGLGQLLLTSVSNRDIFVVQGVVMMLAAAVLLVNFAVDVAYHLLDPRLRGHV